MTWETLLCIGDSITIGSRTYLGYPEYTCDLLRRHLGHEWVSLNFAVSGLKTNEIQRNLGFEVEKFKSMSPGLVTVLAGTNDARDKTPPELFRIAYRQLITKTLLIRPPDQLLLFLIPALQAGIKYPYTLALNPLIEEYNGMVLGLAKEYGIETCKLTLDASDFCDGVHLNNAGVKRVAAQLATHILSARGIPFVP